MLHILAVVTIGFVLALALFVIWHEVSTHRARILTALAGRGSVTPAPAPAPTRRPVRFTAQRPLIQRTVSLRAAA